MNVLIVDDQASQRAIIRHLVQDIDANLRVGKRVIAQSRWASQTP